MPQYKNAQYGLKQYGFFQTTTNPGSGTTSVRWQFVRSRFGAVRKGHTFWLYTHRPAAIKGPVSKLRIKTNTTNWIQEETIRMKGKPLRVRLSSNTSEKPLTSGNLIE